MPKRENTYKTISANRGFNTGEGRKQKKVMISWRDQRVKVKIMRKNREHQWNTLGDISVNLSVFFFFFFSSSLYYPFG